jgi:hypothetical protein
MIFRTFFKDALFELINESVEDEINLLTKTEVLMIIDKFRLHKDIASISCLFSEDLEKMHHQSQLIEYYRGSEREDYLKPTKGFLKPEDC